MTVIIRKSMVRNYVSFFRSLIAIFFIFQFLELTNFLKFQSHLKFMRVLLKDHLHQQVENQYSFNFHLSMVAGPNLAYFKYLSTQTLLIKFDFVGILFCRL